MTLPADYHLHTHNSGDSQAPMEGMIQSAISKCFDEICFTEHMDMDYPFYEELEPDQFTLDIESYHNEFLKYQKQYQDRITLKYGIEIGLQKQIAAENTACIRNNSFDFVIASIHVLNRKDPFYPGFWDGLTTKEIYRDYFQQTLDNLMLFEDYDVLGHIDYVVRYSPDKGASYDYREYLDIIDAILQHLIRNDKGLDINTKQYRITTDEPNPCTGIIKRYAELGGKIITFGSDAHSPERIGNAFNDAVELIRSCGISSYCTFSERKPIFHKLEP